MKIGTVTGVVRASKKVDCLTSQRFLMVDTCSGEVVAADLVGAEPKDRVLLATGSVASRYSMEATVDAAVVAVLEPNDSRLG